MMIFMRKLINIIIAIAIVISPAYLYAKTTREQIQGRKEDSIEKRQTFKENASEIKDIRKQAIVEKIDKQISTLNTKHTNRFKKLLDKLSSILDRIEKRAVRVEDEGADIKDVTLAISNARSTITEAIEILNNQADKDYVIELTDDQNLGQTVSAAFQKFKDEMAALRDLVKEARDDVKDAHNALQLVIKSSNSENGSKE